MLLYAAFALLVLAQAVGLNGLRRPGQEALYSVLTVLIIGLAGVSGGMWLHQLIG